MKKENGRHGGFLMVTVPLDGDGSLTAYPELLTKIMTSGNPIGILRIMSVQKS
jgi:hypothetical protein